MKVRMGALSIIVLSIIGIGFFTTTPLISAREKVQGSDAGGSWDIVITLTVSFIGYGKYTEKGVQYDSDYYYEELWEPATWIYYGKSFPIRITIMTLIGLVFSTIAGVLSLFGYNTKARIIGGILGIISGGTTILFEMLFVDWGGYFRDMFSPLFSIRSYNLGFIIPIIVGGMVIIVSIVLLLIKPKMKEEQEQMRVKNL